MTSKTLFGPDWYQDPNDNRIHDENGDDILDKHSLGELQKIVNSHPALVAALVCAEADLEGLVESKPDDHPARQTLREIHDALAQVTKQENQTR